MMLVKFAQKKIFGLTPDFSLRQKLLITTGTQAE